MNLAAYEKRDLTATKRVRFPVGMTMLVIAVWAAFWIVPPVGWYADAPWTGSGPLLWEALSGSYSGVLAEWPTAVPAYTHVLAAFTTGWRIPSATGMVFEFYIRVAGCLLAWIVAWLTVSRIMMRGAAIVDTRKHYEGQQLQQGRDARRSALASMAREDREQGLGIALAPGVVLSRLREIRGVLLLGAPGSAKTRIILHLLQEIFAAMYRVPNRNVRVLIHDTTGEILSGLPLPDAAFAALHGHRPGGYAWAVGRDVLTKSDAEAFGALLAPHTDETIWESGSGTLLAGCAVLCQSRHGTAWGMPEFYEATLSDPVELKAQLQAVYPPAAELIEVDPETGGLSRTTVSFFLSLRAAVLRFLRPLADNWRDLPANRQFSFREWLDGSNPIQPRTVVVQRAGRYPELSAAWIGAVIDTIAAHVNDESFPNSQTRRVFLCLDELASLGRLRRFPDLVDLGRNKGVGVLAAALHEVEQLQERYGDKVATSILRRFRTKIICQQNLDGGTVQFSEHMIGKRIVEVEETTTTATTGPQGRTTSQTKASAKKEVPIVRAERLAFELGVFGTTVKAIAVGIGDPALLTWPVTVWRRRR
ncbi:type IV secretion system DNA-binding domain-containing protein [Bradyrhizobium sp. I1.7.5]|uniref:type IV secretion system DNA-binding domain-containing protein n=1 Tax=Bradyrhizobium sp. I1.7.5 TaxID=3156363 RepID=UPI003394FEE3